jgi:release factor glutamine methyltransferase
MPVDQELLSAFRAGLTYIDAQKALKAVFQSGGLPSPALDARFLLQSVAGTADKACSDTLQIDEPQSVRLREIVRRRLSGEPVDRIIGNSEFWSRRFDLNADTLSPRPDTETIIEVALGVVARTRSSRCRILDLGTGTGAILVTLLAECPTATGTGTDVSPGALAMARHNCELNGVADRALLVQGRWSDDLTGPYDIVVSNPPYIPSADIAALQQEVRDHDPILALDGGVDGLQAYREIADDLARIIAPDGYAIFEIGAGQASDVEAILLRSGFVLDDARRDLGGHMRALCFKKAG